MSVIIRFPDHGFRGRRKIYTDKREITDENIVAVIGKSLAIHNQNKAQIEYLYNVYRGYQDIRLKQKLVRQTINNKVCINRANEIVTFKTSYILSDPITYISTGMREDISNSVVKFNEFMRMEDKSTKDKELMDWIHIAGVGQRLVLPDAEGDAYGSPVTIETLDPREAFCVYHGGIGHKRLLGCVLQRDEDGKPYVCAYSANHYWEIQGGQIIRSEGHPLNRVPIIEYENNKARLGAFEIVLSILNAINNLSSLRVDNVQDFVNAFDVFQNCEIDDETYKSLTSGGQAIEIKCTVPGMEAKVYRISSELSQNGIQTTVDDMYDSVLEICGMPNRNGGTSTSDTGTAVIFRDGWSAAESRAKDTENSFVASEQEFLRIALDICRNVTEVNINPYEIKPEFTRKNLTNISNKVNVLVQMLSNEKIHPKLAFQYSGVFPDPDDAYAMSMEYYNQQQEAFRRTLADEIGGRADGNEGQSNEE